MLETTEYFGPHLVFHIGAAEYDHNMRIAFLDALRQGDGRDVLLEGGAKPDDGALTDELDQVAGGAGYLKIQGVDGESIDAAAPSENFSFSSRLRRKR